MSDVTPSSARITGWGTALPDKVVTNADLEDTPRHQRRVDRRAHRHPRAAHRRHHHRASASRPAQAAMDAGRRRRRRHRPRAALHLARPTRPCRPAPAPSSRRSACAAAPSTSTPPARASSTASSPPTASCAPACERVLLIGSETMSRIVDWDDRSTAILFGDGAGAVVLERGDGPGRRARLRPRLRRLAAPHPPRRLRRHHRDGRPGGVPPGRAGHGRLGRAGPRARPASRVDDLALFVPHQANTRIIASACAKLGIGEDRTVNILATTGNTSAASIPLALAEAADAGRLAARATSCCSSASAPACRGPPP